MLEQNPFCDAQSLQQRAQKRIKDFSQILSSAWSIHHESDAHRLILNRDALEQSRILAADISNDLIHALDHVVAACARLQGHENNPKLYFPFESDNEHFHKQMNKLCGFIGDDFAGVFLALREECFSLIGALKTAKEISNSSKHWQLVPTTTQSNGIGYTIPGQKIQTIIEIPDGHFEHQNEFVFQGPNGIPFQVIIGFRFVGEHSSQCDPVMVFSQAAIYVAKVIERVKSVADSR